MLLEELKNKLDRMLGGPHEAHIETGHMQEMATLLNGPTALEIIDQILADESLLIEVAGRSYTHSLGFKKIILLDPGLALPEGTDGTREFGWQLRLHIWEPGQGVPLVESMHEHSFDFISHVLDGTMENQCYLVEPLDDAQQRIWAAFRRKLEELTPPEITQINNLLELLEARRLTKLGSKQAWDDESTPETETLLETLAALSALPPAELPELISLQGRYQAVSTSCEKGSYVHQLKEMVSMRPHEVFRLQAGDTYFHPHAIAHRLYMGSQASSTLLVTAPAAQDAMGGSLQRPTWVPGNEVSYERRMYDPAELKAILLAYRSRLTPVTPGRLVDIAGDRQEYLRPELAMTSISGCRKPRNEDYGALAQVTAGGINYSVLIVADGVSSSRDPHLAARAACLAAKTSLVADLKAPPEQTEFQAAQGNIQSQLQHCLRRAFTAAQEAVVSLSSTLPNLSTGKCPPQCTMLAAIVADNQVELAWLGDCRAYFLPLCGGSRLLTRDHSWVNARVDSGEMSLSEALQAPEAHWITHCLGTLDEGEEFEPSYASVDISSGKILLLCSDGFWNYGHPRQDQRAIPLLDQMHRMPQGADAALIAERLAAFACASGGHDNITVAVLKLS